MNIVYFIPHLREASGINRVLNIKANYLADVLNYNVTIITYRQHESVIFFDFSDKVKIINFDLDDPSFRLGSLSFIERRIQIRRFMSTYKNLVEQFLTENKIDVCISLFLGAEYKFLHELKDKSKKIVEFHLNFEHSPFKILNKQLRVTNVKSKIQINLLRQKLSKYGKIVVLTKKDSVQWEKYFPNITVICNPLTIDINNPRPLLSTKKAISVGRLEREKGFDFLVSAWSIVNKKHPDWSLSIYGEGCLENNLLAQIKNLGLENCIVIKKPVTDIVNRYLDSSLFILSSRNEGFVLVLLEAMALGIPSVSFNCNYGPDELIVNGKNGFLVEVGNINDLAARIIQLLENENLRKTFSEASILSTTEYSVPKILSKWDQLFKSLI